MRQNRFPFWNNCPDVNVMSSTADVCLDRELSSINGWGYKDKRVIRASISIIIATVTLTVERDCALHSVHSRRTLIPNTTHRKSLTLIITVSD